jgi:hypothetical protein
MSLHTAAGVASSFAFGQNLATLSSVVTTTMQLCELVLINPALSNARQSCVRCKP